MTDDDIPSLWELEEKAEQLVVYFEKVEARLSDHTGQPVNLVETRTAIDLSVGLSRLQSAEREHYRFWKHRDPDETVIAFAGLVRQFIEKEGLSWEELAERLGFYTSAFDSIKWFGAEDE